MSRLAIAFFFLVAALPANSKDVAIQQGNVVLVDDGRVTMLTRSGHDKDASMSPDGAWVLFVRQDPAQMRDRTGASSRGPSTAIWVVRSDGTDERVLLPEGASSKSVPYYGDYAAPQFLSDSKHFVFWSEQSAVSGVVGKSDLYTRRIELVCGGNTVEVLRGGKYNDHLIVQQHRYFLGNGAYDWYWLYDPMGSEVGPIGDSKSDVELFKEDYAGL